MLTGRGALQRLLPQRAADEAPRPARPAPGAVRRLRRDRSPRLGDGDEARSQAALRAFEIVLLQGDRPLARPRHRDRVAPRRSSPARALPRPRRRRRRRRPGRDRRDGRRRDPAGAAGGARRRRPRRAAARRRAARWPSCGRSCGRSFTIISAPQLRTRHVMLEAQALGPMNPLVTTGLDARGRSRRSRSTSTRSRCCATSGRCRSRASSALARIALEAGAHGITVHPRPDERHIRADDVRELAALLKDWPQAEFNIEGNPVPRT